MILLTNIIFWILYAGVFPSFGQVIRYFPETTIPCASGANCPEAWPCCSQFGMCGSGPFCIGGCNPRFSNKPGSCLGQPALLPPISSNFKAQSSMEEKPALHSSFNIRKESSFGSEAVSSGQSDLNKRGLIYYADFLISPLQQKIKGMLRDYHFTYSGFVSYSGPGQLTLGMPRHSTGSIISATKSFLYGRSTVKMKTARGRGVVTAIVLLSAVGDEIDFEFIGGELLHTQSNYYHQGELNHTRMVKLPVASDSFANTHIYEVDWNEERIHWIIDGAIARTLYKKETWNEEKKLFEYPQTPMRLQVSVWPAGRVDAAPGTIQWAGGLIDWDNSPDILQTGQFYATVESVTITPFENKFWSQIVTDLQKSKQTLNSDTLLDITYDFNYDTVETTKWREESVVWKRGKLPYLSAPDKNGLNPGEAKFGTMVDRQLLIEQDVNPDNQFIQYISKKLSTTNNDMLLQDPSSKNEKQKGKSKSKNKNKNKHKNKKSKKDSKPASSNGRSFHDLNPIRRLITVFKLLSLTK